MMTNKNVAFDKKVSKILKGFLVVIMYWSHMFNHPERLQKEIEWIPLIKLGGLTIEEFLVPLFHVAVPCFFFVAGYGYYVSNLKETRSAKKQILGLYTKYWIVFATFIPLCAILGKILITPVSLLLNLIGLSSSYCGEWWFLSTYVEIIFVFSLTDKYIATVYKGNIIKNLIMDCQSYTKYRPNETTGGIFVSWRRKEELPTGA